MSATNLERDHVVIVGGRVHCATHMVSFNGSEPWPAIQIERRGDCSFRSMIGTRDEGAVRVGSFEDVTDGLHEKLRSQYQALFELAEPDERAVRTLPGFEGYEVVIR